MKVLVKEVLSPHKYKTPEGYLICTDAILARTGKQEYQKNEVFADSEDNSIIEIDRREEDVFDEKTIASFEDKPITVEHPSENVGPENYRYLSVGHVRNVRKGEYNGQPVMLGDLVITDADIIKDIEEGVRTELSCGYDCDIIDDGGYTQQNIRGNHIALCEKGRAGVAKIVDAAVKDKLEYIEVEDIGKSALEALKKKYKIEINPENKVVKEYILYKDGKKYTIEDYGFKQDVVFAELKLKDSVKDSMSSEVRNWWRKVEEANSANKWGFNIGNFGADDEEMLMAMFDMIADLKNKDIKLYQEGKRIYNKYSRYSQYKDLVKDINPRSDETEKEFISRFMSETKSEYPDENQRLAVAYSYWNNAHDAICDEYIVRKDEIKSKDFDKIAKQLGFDVESTNKEFILRGGNDEMYKKLKSLTDAEDEHKYIIEYIPRDRDAIYVEYIFAKSSKEAIEKFKKLRKYYRITEVRQVKDSKVKDSKVDNVNDSNKYLKMMNAIKQVKKVKDSRIRDEKVKTPRGEFELVNKTEEQLKKEGYGFHHSYKSIKVFTKNDKAVAIKDSRINDYDERILNELKKIAEEGERIKSDVDKAYKAYYNVGNYYSWQKLKETDPRKCDLIIRVKEQQEKKVADLANKWDRLIEILNRSKDGYHSNFNRLGGTHPHLPDMNEYIEVKQRIKSLEKTQGKTPFSKDTNDSVKVKDENKKELLHRWGFLNAGNVLRRPEGAELKFKYHGLGNFKDIIKVIEARLGIKHSAIDYDKEEVYFFKKHIVDSKVKDSSVIEECIRKLKSSSIPLNSHFQVGKIDDVLIQIQNIGQDNWLFDLKHNIKYNGLSSSAWGRIWYKNKLVFNEHEPLNLLRAHMIEKLRQLNTVSNK